MEQIFNIASAVSTPLGLGGLFAAILFFTLKQLLEQRLFPKLAQSHGADLIKLIVERLFVLALVAMVLGFVGYLITKLPSSQPSLPSAASALPPPTEARVVVCSGRSCQVGDWPVGTAFPTPFGDCTVAFRVEDLNTSHKVDRITVQGIQGLTAGAEPSAFTITKAEIHPSAYTNPAVRTNLQLCGYVTDTQDRRAVVRLLITYK